MKALAAVLLVFAVPATAAEPSDIFEASKGAVAFIEVPNGDGKVVQTGTGFFVARNGYLVTADHLRPEGADGVDGGEILARLGGRGGRQVSLERLDYDRVADLALWRVKNSGGCVQAAGISTRIPAAGELVTIIGYNRGYDVAPITGRIAVVRGPGGSYPTDANVTEGTSGGPAFDETGSVIAVVRQGPATGRGPVELVPISRASVMFAKFNVQQEAARSGEECSAGLPLELLGGTVETRIVKSDASMYFDAGRLRAGQEMLLCLGLGEQNPARQPTIIVWLGVPFEERIEWPSAQPFLETNRACKLGDGKGTLYAAMAPRDGSFRVYITYHGNPNISDRFTGWQETLYVSLGKSGVRQQ